jgi:hypothetical protein
MQYSGLVRGFVGTDDDKSRRWHSLIQKLRGLVEKLVASSSRDGRRSRRGEFFNGVDAAQRRNDNFVMPYASGPHPARLDRRIEPSELDFPSYTLIDQSRISQESATAGRHLGEVTSVAVRHRFAELRQRLAFVGEYPNAWYSVVTTRIDAPNGLSNLDEAMSNHLARNTSNLEVWPSRQLVGTTRDRVRVEGETAIARVTRISGLTAIGLERGDCWVTVVIPDLVADSLVPDLVSM